MHVIKSKAELTTTIMKRLLEILSSYSFNVILHKRKRHGYLVTFYLGRNMMIVTHMQIIPISFNMQNVLQSRYFNMGNERKEEKYLVQTRSQAKSSGITLPEVHGVYKGKDPNILPEKQAHKAYNIL